MDEEVSATVPWGLAKNAKPKPRAKKAKLQGTESKNRNSKNVLGGVCTVKTIQNADFWFKMFLKKHQSPCYGGISGGIGIPKGGDTRGHHSKGISIQTADTKSTSKTRNTRARREKMKMGK